MDKLVCVQYCPELVCEWIDGIILPNKADGTKTAQQIAEEVVFECKERLDSETAEVDFYLTSCHDPLIDSWVVIPGHEEILAGYIQAVFNTWE